MSIKDHKALVTLLYRRLLRREPATDELAYWADWSERENDAEGLCLAFFESDEYKDHADAFEKIAHSPGHFYSPINDVSAGPALTQDQQTSIDVSEIRGIAIDLDQQKELWRRFTRSFDQFAFHADQHASSRYFYNNGVYGPGDALVLSSMISLYKPNKIIEIGSGFSSACMADTVQRLKLRTQLTFIEPYPVTLHSLVPNPEPSWKILVKPVQATELSLFESLLPNDILFIDSSHVMKHASDVNFELFDILPRLRSGVIVHFHDIFYPFEYPMEWIFERRYSWNELYGVRAFLMHNHDYRILFFNHAFGVKCRDFVADHSPPAMRDLFLSNPGGGLWLQKQ